MKLLRKCPCPVCLVRHGNVDQHPQILAAVNASTGEASERALNITIVELALLISDFEGGVPPSLLQAWHTCTCSARVGSEGVARGREPRRSSPPVDLSLQEAVCT